MCIEDQDKEMEIESEMDTCSACIVRIGDHLYCIGCTRYVLYVCMYVYVIMIDTIMNSIDMNMKNSLFTIISILCLLSLSYLL